MPGEKAEFSFCQKIYIQNVNVFLFCDSPPNAPLSVKAVWDNPGRNMGHFFRISLFNSLCGEQNWVKSGQFFTFGESLRGT